MHYGSTETSETSAFTRFVQGMGPLEVDHRLLVRFIQRLQPTLQFEDRIVEKMNYVELLTVSLY